MVEALASSRVARILAECDISSPAIVFLVERVTSMVVSACRALSRVALDEAVLTAVASGVVELALE